MLFVTSPTPDNETMKIKKLVEQEKQVYYKIRPIDDSAYMVVSAEDLGLQVQDWLDSANETAELVISAVEMTEAEFEALPEYEG